MENIEQLKQDNAKLTERLNNAGKFFREQKAQIETLTKENEQLKDQINSLQFNEESDADVINDYSEELNKYKNTVELLNNSIDELNKTIDSKDQAYKVLQDTYNELFGENSKLKEDLENRVKQVRVTENQADEELKKVITARDEWIVKYRELEEKYNEVFKASQDLGKELAEAQAKYINELANRDKDLQEAIATYKLADDKYNKLVSKCEELTSTIAKLEADNNNLRKSDQEYRKTYEELKKDNEKLNKLYDDLENQKLGLECDFANLEDKYKNLKLQSDFNTENEKYLADKIFNIWTICDDIIHPVPEEQIEKIKNEENKESTIVINSESEEENIENLPNKQEQPKHQFMSDALINI